MAMSQMYLAACKPVEILSRQSGVAARLECKCCGTHEEWGLAKVPPPNIIHKHFKTKGWEVAKRPTCPICQSSKKRKPAMTKPSTVTPISSAVTVAPSVDAKAARREAHDRIAIYFNIEKGSYSDGYSDMRIAEETGVAVAWVKQRREEEFGQLKVPSEIQEIVNEVSKLHSELNEVKHKYQRALEDFKFMFDEECTSLKRATDAYMDVHKKLTDVCKRNGWQ